MRRALALLLLALAHPALAVGPNPPVVIQPDEQFVWYCDFHVAVASVVSTTVTLLQGTDTDCTSKGVACTNSTLVSNIQVNNTNANQAIWRFTPTGKASGNVYHVHILAEDTGGSRLACDGQVNVKKVKIVL